MSSRPAARSRARNGGYRPEGASGLDALLAGYYEGRDLRFADTVRAGLLPHVGREFLGKLKPPRALNVRSDTSQTHQRVVWVVLEKP